MDVKIKAKFTESANLNAGFKQSQDLSAGFDNAQIVHTDNYDDLYNKPIINDVVVRGDKVGEDYNLQDKMHALTTQEIEKILYL